MTLLSLFVVLPVALWVLLLLAFIGSGLLYREAALAATTALAAFTVVLTESLSLVSWLSSAGVISGWALAVLLAALVLRERWLKGLAVVRLAGWPQLDVWDRIVVGVLTFFAVGTFLAAFLYPIVNFDSLTYHMPRVLMWYQNHSVRFYPVVDGRHLFSSTFVEYCIINLKILAGGSDRLANLVQWLSYGLAVCIASLIAFRLGASRRGQQVSALAVASVPLALLEASTTQTDLMTAMWCMALVYLVLTFVRQQPSTTRAIATTGCWMGLVLALAFQSKASAYLVCAPFLLWLAITGLRRDGVKRSAILAGCLLLSTLLLSAGIYARNASVLGLNIIASDAPAMDRILVSNYQPQTLATTTLKNLSLLIRLPIESANEVLVGAVSGAAAVFGGDVESPATKDLAARPFRLNGFTSFAHDEAPAPLSVLLLLVALLVIVTRGDNRGRGLAGFAVCVVAVLLLISALVAWNEYVTRILLPPLLIGLSAVGLAADAARRSRGHGITAVLVAAVLGASILWGGIALLFGWTNPLLPGSFLPLPKPAPILLHEYGWWNTSYHDLGFRMNIPDKQAAYERVAQAVRENNIRRLLIAVPSGRPLYPLLVMMPQTRIQYGGDTIFPQQIPPGDFMPDAVLEFTRVETGTPSPDDRDLVEPQQVSGKSFMVLRRP